MDRRRRGRQARASAFLSARRLWLAAAGALVVTYALVMLSVAPSSLSGDRPEAQAAALGDARAADALEMDAQPKEQDEPIEEQEEAETDAEPEERAHQLLRVEESEEPAVPLETPMRPETASPLIIAEAEKEKEAEEQNKLQPVPSAVGDLPVEAEREKELQPIPTAVGKLPIAAEKKIEGSGLDAHLFTNIDNLPGKEDGDKTDDSSLAEHLFTNIDTLPEKANDAKTTDDSSLAEHLFTNIDNLPVKVFGAKNADDSSLADHLFTDIDKLPGRASDAEKDSSLADHLFSGASYFDNLNVAEGDVGSAEPTQTTDAPNLKSIAQAEGSKEDMAEHLFSDASDLDSMMKAAQPSAPAKVETDLVAIAESKPDDLGSGSDEEEEEELPPPRYSHFDQSRQVTYIELASEVVPFEQRHDIIAGYDATLEYLANYTTPSGSNEQLFLFFVCSDAYGAPLDWKPICADAKKKVYDVFAKSPSFNRLVTIYSGPEDVWQQPNMLKEDDDLRLKSIPCVMRWDGGTPGAKRSSYGMMIDDTLLSEPFLRYLFRNTDQVDQQFSNPDVATKEIVTVKGYQQYTNYMDTYRQENSTYPLFVILYSGRWKANNRLWCPFSRQSELPLEYSFYAYAPKDARFLVVETYDLYKRWRSPDNEFKQDPILKPKGVPWMLRVFPEANGELRFQKLKGRLYIQESLEKIFSS